MNLLRKKWLFPRCVESLIKIMSLISTPCLFVLVLIFLPFPIRSDGSDGFPDLNNNAKIKAALQKIFKEDFGGFSLGGTPIDVKGVMLCYAENAECFANETVKNEVRLRNGYKTFGEGCSADPALNQHLFSPPSIRDLVAYPIWQRHLLDANQPLCSPFKHLQCSKTTAKCECRPGLIWGKGPFPNFETKQGPFTIVHEQAPREREEICIFDLNKPCQMREYPGDELVDSKSLSLKEIGEGMPIAEYFAIFYRVLGGDLTQGILGIAVQSPSCGAGECSKSFYTQRQRVCATRNWDSRVSDLEKHFLTENSILMPIGFKCDSELHRRLYTFSADELSGPSIRARRKKTLEDLKESQTGENRVRDLMSLVTCSPTSGLCECIHPTIPTKSSPPSCVLPEALNKCDMTNGIIKILHNEIWTRGAKLLLNEGVEFKLGGCRQYFKCHVGLDIDDEMEIYCTCSIPQRAGITCLDDLTGFLMQMPRVPSFPSDGKDIDEKWMIFNEFNKKAIQFQEIFKLSEGQSCDFSADAEASTLVEQIRRLDKKGTVMTKAQYKKLSDTIVKLTKQHQNGQGVCRRLNIALACHPVNRTCSRVDPNFILEACKHLADTCELEGIVLAGGRCVCDPKFLRERSTASKPGANSTSSVGVVKAPSVYYFPVVGIIIIVINSNY